MKVVIADEQAWRRAGRGRRLDVLRAYIEDQDDYLWVLASALRMENKLVTDSIVVYVEYEEPDPEFTTYGTKHLCAYIIDETRVPSERNSFLGITKDSIDFVIAAKFTDTTNKEAWAKFHSRYCPVSFSMMTLEGSPPPPDRMGIVIESIPEEWKCIV